jgi:hypothetical protein
MVPYGIGLGADLSTFVAQTLWLDVRYDYVVATIPSVSTRARSGHYASGFIGIPILHERGKTEARLYLEQNLEIDGIHIKYRNARTGTHHYLLLDAGVVTAPLSYGLCPETCTPDVSTTTQVDIQAVMPGAGVRYLYTYKVDSPQLSRASRGWAEVGVRALLPALNAPIGEVYYDGARVNTDRPGFVVDVAFEMFSFWPGVWLLGAGMTPSHMPLYFELGYGYYWF